MNQAALSNQAIKALKAEAHSKKPVVLIGQKGITESVIAEIDLALNHHELIKVKIAGQERADRQVIANEICEKTNASQIQIIGQILVLYRENEKD